jgi:hypothetical protein
MMSLWGLRVKAERSYDNAGFGCSPDVLHALPECSQYLLSAQQIRNVIQQLHKTMSLQSEASRRCSV